MNIFRNIAIQETFWGCMMARIQVKEGEGLLI